MAEDMKHTPGPWRIEYSLECGYIRSDCDVCARRGIREPVSIAQLFSMEAGEDHPDRSAANARLIAAAPELYEALASVNKLISEAAMTGFNWRDGDWPERLFFSQQATSKALHKARGDGPQPIGPPQDDAGE